MISIDDIEDAASRLRGVSNSTPLISSPTLDEACGGRVYLKPECLQVTGSFKIRGAYNRLSQLSARESAKGVVAWSSGNHAQGVAAAGRLLGIKTTIVMPEDAPPAKLANTVRLGGEVITYDRYSGDREALAREIATSRGAALVPSYDHPDVMAGQGTVGLEIAAELGKRGVVADSVIVPCGGGGLSSGIATALRARMPQTKLIGVEPEDFDDTQRSLIAGSRQAIDSRARSICDALQSPIPGQLTFAINQQFMSKVITVSDIDVRAAMRFAFQELKIVVEPGGAVGLAAMLQGAADTRAKTTVCVLSGGNVDEALFNEIQLERN